MLLGGFGRLPALMGGGKPEAMRIYEAMRDNRGERYSRDDGGDENRSLRCAARRLAIAASYQRRGALQAYPNLATDLLPEWERRLGVTPDPRDTQGQRRALLDGILAGNGPPDYDHIVAAVGKALDGESVSVVAGLAAERTAGADVTFDFTATAIAGGALLAGTHHVGAAFELASGEWRPVITSGGARTVSVVLTAGQGVRCGAIPLSTAAGAVRVHYYLSVAANSSSVAYVADSAGGAVDVYGYPKNVGTPGLHTLGIVVSAATWASKVKRSKIHAVLGGMLPSWVNYNIITSSPFVLGDPGGSLLSLGGF